jgi:hypothetical protein
VRAAPDPGQYNPKYSSIIKSSYKNPIVFKADRFLTKEVFPNTWLNKPEIAKALEYKKMRTANMTP